MKRTYWIDPIETKDDCGCSLCKIRNGEKFTVEDGDEFRDTMWLLITGAHEVTGRNQCVNIIKKSIDETKEKINDKKESNKKERR